MFKIVLEKYKIYGKNIYHLFVWSLVWVWLVKSLEMFLDSPHLILALRESLLIQASFEI